MSTQNVSILPIFQKISLRLRKQFILNCPRKLIQLILILYSVYQSQITLPRIKKRTKAIKRGDEPKYFDAIYSAVNVRLKTNNIRHLKCLVFQIARFLIKSIKKYIYKIIETQKNLLSILRCSKAKKQRVSRYLDHHFGSNSISI